MPQRPRIRSPHDGPAPPLNDGRRAWLSQWKEWAVGRLPASASAATRSRVRHDIERALARLVVEDPENEARDVVEATIEPILQELADREARVARERCKRENLQQIEACLEHALWLRRGPRTTAMVRRPKYAKPVLVERLRRRLGRELTGDESSEEVLEQTIAFVDRCLAKQPPPPRRWGRSLATGTVVTALVTAKVLEQNPELGVLANKGIAVGRDKLRVLLLRFTSVPKPPT